MIRYSLLTIFIATICVWSFRDWYKALCALIPILAVMERPDMPRSILGIPGLNLYNVALLCVMTAFLMDRASRSVGRLPNGFGLLFGCYLILIAISTARMFLDMGEFYDFYDVLHIKAPPQGELIIDHIADPFRFLIPGLLLSAGFQNRERVVWGVGGILAMGALFAVQVIIKMMPALLDGQDLGDRALRVLDRDIGYHRVAASSVLGMIVPAYLAVYICKNKLIPRWVPLLGLPLTFLGLALTGGRLGMLAALGAGAALAMLRNKMLLIYASLLLVLAIPLIPGLQDRLFSGVEESEQEMAEKPESNTPGEELGLITEGGIDLYEITSGRIAVWPLVWGKIKQAPLTGYGKEAMLREGITVDLMQIIDPRAAKNFTHPHNAYLELVLDHGFIGTALMLMFIFYLIGSALRGYLQKDNDALTLVSAVLLGYLATFIIAGIGSGSFYPQLRTVTMWCMIGLFLSTRYRWNQVEETDASTSTGSDKPAVMPASEPLWSRLKKPGSQPAGRRKQPAGALWSDGQSGRHTS